MLTGNVMFLLTLLICVLYLWLIRIRHPVFGRRKKQTTEANPNSFPHRPPKPA